MTFKKNRHSLQVDKEHTCIKLRTTRVMVSYHTAAVLHPCNENKVLNNYLPILCKA